MNYQALLLGAQAAGIGASILSSNSTRKATQSAIEAERAQLDLRAEQEQLAFAEANIASIESLSEVLAGQRALLAARGTNAGQGSAFAVAQKSVRTQSADTEARKLNQKFREAQMQGLNRLLNIKSKTTNAQFGTSLLETGLSSFNLNSSIGQWLNSQAPGGTKKTDYVTKNKSPYSAKKPQLIVGGNY